MERKKRRGYRESGGDGETVSLGAVPRRPLSPPRKRAASLDAAARSQEDTGVLRITLGEARAASDEREDSAHAATALLESDGQKDAGGLEKLLEEEDNMAMAWSLERNLPKEAFLPTLLRAYDSIHARYTRMKARKMDIETQFEEQRCSHERFQQVADRYIQDMCSENQELRKTLAAAEKRIRWLESLYQKDGLRSADAVQKPEREADVAASPVRPLTPTSDTVPAEGAPVPAEAQPPPERGAEEIAECHVEDTVGNQGNEEAQEMARDCERLVEVATAQGNVSTEGCVETGRSEEAHHLVSTQNSVSEACPALDNALENARCLEDSAPDKAVAVCPEPVDCRLHSNEAEFLDLHRKYVELQDLHRKEVELLDQQRQEAELQFHHREEAELQNLHRKEVELQHLHRKEIAGLLLEVEMLQKVLGHFFGMTVVSDEVARARKGKPTLLFSHSRTGFRFSLEESELEGAQDVELSYRNLSLGTLCRVAPWWMKEDFFCSVTQLGNFMRRFQETVTGRKL